MKDHQAITLKAFLIALIQQTEPLPPDLQAKLNGLSQNLLANLVKLDEIAIAHPNLVAPYEAALALLDSPHERSKGAINLGDSKENSSNIDNLWLDNTTPFSESTNLEIVLSKLKELPPKETLQFSQETTRAQDSVQHTKDNLANLLKFQLPNH